MYFPLTCCRTFSRDSFRHPYMIPSSPSQHSRLLRPFPSPVFVLRPRLGPTPHPPKENTERPSVTTQTRTPLYSLDTKPRLSLRRTPTLSRNLESRGQSTRDRSTSWKTGPSISRFGRHWTETEFSSLRSDKCTTGTPDSVSTPSYESSTSLLTYEIPEVVG